MNSLNLAANKPTQDIAWIAVQHGAEGRSCSEAVMLAFAPSLGLAPGVAVKLASGFGGGMGVSGEVCGALSAACMVIGLRFGTEQVSDSYTRQRTYMLVQELLERFRSETGAVQCRELCFARLGAGQGFADVRKMDLPERLISLAANTLEQIINGGTE